MLGTKLDQQTTLEGIFEVTRARSAPTASATRRLILICRDGRLFGADPQGRVYTGFLMAETTSPAPRSLLRGIYEVPLRRRSSRRAMPRRPSMRLPISGMVDPFARAQRATVRIGVTEVDIEITYMGPLPP
jgi:hypothetical protein